MELSIDEDSAFLKTWSTARSDDDQIAIFEILDGQVDAPKDELVAMIAGPFQPVVAHVFPGAYQALYLLTENGRRQVWHACFAPGSATGFSTLLKQEPTALRHMLTRQGNERLLQQAYEHVPAGFAKLLGKLGVRARAPQCYIDLHRLMSASPEFRRPLSKMPRLDERAIRMVEALGAKFALPNIIDVIYGRYNAGDLGMVLQDFIDHGLITEHELLERLKRVERAGQLSRLVASVYSRIPFPSPPVPSSEMCRAIATFDHLKDAARRHRNCLATLFPSVIKGKAYFYEWFGEEPAIVELRADPPFGWLVGHVEGVDGNPVTQECRAAIVEHFAGHGVRDRGSVERIMRSVADGDDADDAELGSILTDLERAVVCAEAYG